MSGLDDVIECATRAENACAEAAMATGDAHNRAEEQAEVMAQLGATAHAAALREVAEPLGEAYRVLLEAHGSAGAAVRALRSVAEVLGLNEIIDRVGGAVEKLRDAATAVSLALVSCRDEARSRAELAQDTELLATVDTTTGRVEAAAVVVAVARDATDAHRARLTNGLGETGGGATATLSDPSTPVIPEPAGKWVILPKRHHGKGTGGMFNKRYEHWARTSTGGPADKEYYVENNGAKAHFDASVVQVRDGKPVEVLIDAKGRYAQFVDKETGDFYDFFQDPRDADQGVRGMVKTAKRHVQAANGRPVEWWFAEQEAADAFQREILRVTGLKGRIKAVHRPMPEWNS